MSKREDILIVLLLLAAAFVCYHAVLDAGFVWDDEYIVLQNPLIRAPLWSFNIFRQDIINSSFTYTIYYRPIQILSYAVDYRLWGLEPLFFHLSNIFIHFLNGVLVFALSWRLLRKKAVSLLAALLFVIHPAHAGAVSYISGRADLLFFFFGFLFMLSYVLFREKKKYVFLWMSAVSLGFSLLSKEAAIIFPFLMLFADVMILRKKYGFGGASHLPAFFVTGAYVTLHRFIFGGRYSLVAGPENLTERFLRFSAMVREFFVLNVFPLELHMRRGAGGPVETLFGPVVVGICLVLLLFYLKKSRRILLFSLGFFLIALMPFVLVAGYFKVFAEHWIYLAGYGIFLFMAVVVIRIYRRRGRLVRSILTVLFFAGIVFYSRVTMDQNIYWLDNISLSDHVLAYSAQDMPAMHFKAVSLMKSGRSGESLEIMDEYAEYHSGDPHAWYIKGRLNLASGRTDTAERDFKRSLQISRNYDNGYLGLALVAFVKGQNREGVEYLERTVELNPRHSEAYLLLGAAYSKAGND